MESLGMLILFFFMITFGPPVMFFIIGLIKHSRNKESAKVYYILSVSWLIIGGGICASLLMN